MGWEVSVYCNRCQRIGGADATAKKARQLLKAEGWKVGTDSDLCPTCQLELVAGIDIDEA